MKLWYLAEQSGDKDLFWWYQNPDLFPHNSINSELARQEASGTPQIMVVPECRRLETVWGPLAVSVQLLHLYFVFVQRVFVYVY